MTEPSSPLVGAAWAAWLTSVVLALTGVDYYALLGAFGGVLLMLGSLRAQTVGTVRIVLTVAITSLTAGVMGQGLADLLHLNTRPVLMLFSLLFGAAGQIGVQTAVEALLARVKKLGGEA